MFNVEHAQLHDGGTGCRLPSGGGPTGILGVRGRFGSPDGLECISSYTPEILHFGVFVSEPEADRALEAYLAVKPGVSYVHEQADAENWVVVVGSTESFAALSGMGYGVTAHD